MTYYWYILLPWNWILYPFGPGKTFIRQDTDMDHQRAALNDGCMETSPVSSWYCTMLHQEKPGKERTRDDRSHVGPHLL